MEDKSLLEGNELIHHFIGGKWRMVDEGAHNHFVDREFESKAACQKMCDKDNKHRPAGNHWIPIAAPSRIAGGVIHYHDSWNNLMPIVEKIESFGLRVEISENNCYIVSKGVEDELYPWLQIFPEQGFARYDNAKINSTWNCIVEFIEWYNEHTKKTTI